MITASFKPSLALSRPATSDHLTFGFSETIAPASESYNFLSPSSPFSSFVLGFSYAEVAPPAPPAGGAYGAI